MERLKATGRASAQAWAAAAGKVRELARLVPIPEPVRKAAETIAGTPPVRALYKDWRFNGALMIAAFVLFHRSVSVLIGRMAPDDLWDSGAAGKLELIAGTLALSASIALLWWLTRIALLASLGLVYLLFKRFEIPIRAAGNAVMGTVPGRVLCVAGRGIWPVVRFIGGASASMLRAFRRDRRFWVSLAVIAAAMLSSLATFLILNDLTPIVPSHYVVIGSLGLTAVLVLSIIGIVVFQITKLLKARKRQTAGAGLHFQLAGIFSFVALIPAVLMAILSTVSIEHAFDALFSNRVKTIVSNSVDVAQNYLVESGAVIRSDMLGIARELEGNITSFHSDRQNFDRLFSAVVSMRNLPSAYLIDSHGTLLSSAVGDGSDYRVPPPPDIAHAADGRIVPLSWDLSNGMAALKKLPAIGDVYLYVIRPVNQNVYRLLLRTQVNVLDFAALERARGQYEAIFAIMYVLLALTLLTTAIWTGLAFANRLVTPIRRLIAAAQEVSQGNLNVQLDEGFARDDIGRLGSTFKKMTVDLETQRAGIMSANAQLDERRRFIEAVLSGVTAGVIGLDPEGRVTLINRSARELLKLKGEKLIGKALNAAVPEFADIIEKSRKSGRSKPVHAQITIVRESGEHNFAVQVTREEEDQASYGVVVTFDDITELTVAQRTSAWADIARRIAHEIKNPLTPIQLSAERIRRKYGDSITTDKEIFDKCIATIVRHVGDIGRMVDEFSSFARMPNAVFEDQDIREIVKEAVILFQMSRHDIEYKLELPAGPFHALCDRRLLTQAVTNLVKNASEAVESYQNGNGKEPEKGRIVIRLQAADHRYVIGVIDNGCGLPKENRHRLVEPYVTTRQKGTGLGLAIVQRITEQHGGVLELEDAPAGEGYAHGACIRMSIPISLAAGGPDAENNGLKPEGRERASAAGAAA
jgi:two-component system, NtrC family, nitrogen regulation sensor histidine kinase NtrY